MNIFDTIVGILWLVLLVFWLVSAASAKSNRGSISWGRQAGIRILLMLAVILVLKSPFRQYAVGTNNAALASLGIALCGAGIGFAIWARVTLGRNWGFPMTLKAEPELVTDGPYTMVRHPIYAGILLAMLGTALVVGAIWLLVIVLFCPYFVYSASREEKLMTEAFPGQYGDYKRRTKMLVPFIF